MRRIIPSITTLGTGSSSWQEKICEVERLGLQEVNLFLTGIDSNTRPQVYALLEQVRAGHFFTIPFVHAVSSMKEEEYRYLTETFGTQKFNLHPVWQYPLEHSLNPEVRRKIFIENVSLEIGLREEDLEGFGGICCDLSHLEDARRLEPHIYDQILVLAEQYEVGANHISAVGSQRLGTRCGGFHYSNHFAHSAEEFGYLEELDPIAVAPLCAIELVNSLADQLRFMEAISQRLNQAQNPSRRKLAA